MRDDTATLPTVQDPTQTPEYKALREKYELALERAEEAEKAARDAQYLPAQVIELELKLKNALHELRVAREWAEKEPAKTVYVTRRSPNEGQSPVTMGLLVGLGVASRTSCRDCHEKTFWTLRIDTPKDQRRFRMLDIDGSQHHCLDGVEEIHNGKNPNPQKPVSGEDSNERRKYGLMGNKKHQKWHLT